MIKYGRREGADKTMTLRDWLPFVSSTGDDDPGPAEPATGLSPIPSHVSQVVANKWPADFTHDDLQYTLNTVQDYAIRAYGPVAYPDRSTGDQSESSADQADHPVVELVNYPERRPDLEEQFHADDNGVDGYIVTAERWDAIQYELEMSDLALRAVQETHAAYAVDLGYDDYGSLLHPLFIATDNPPALEGEVAETPTDQSTDQEGDEQDEKRVTAKSPIDSPGDTSTGASDTPGNDAPVDGADVEAEIETAADAGDSETAPDTELKRDTDTQTEAETTDPATASKFVFDESIKSENSETRVEAGSGGDETDSASTGQNTNRTAAVDDTDGPKTGAPADRWDFDEIASGSSGDGSQPSTQASSVDQDGASPEETPATSRAKSSDGGAIDTAVERQEDDTGRTGLQADGRERTENADTEWPAWMFSAVEPQYSARNN